MRRTLMGLAVVLAIAGTAWGFVADEAKYTVKDVMKQAHGRGVNLLTKVKSGNATDAEKEHLQDLTRRLVNKLLNEPVQALRRADDTHPGGGDQYAHAMQHLFRLSEAMPGMETNENDEAEPTSNE